MPEKGSKPQRRAVVLVFGAGGDQRKVETPKTSSGARFRGGGGVDARERSKPRRRAVVLVFRAGGDQRKVVGGDQRK